MADNRNPKVVQNLLEKKYTDTRDALAGLLYNQNMQNKTSSLNPGQSQETTGALLNASRDKQIAQRVKELDEIKRQMPNPSAAAKIEGWFVKNSPEMEEAATKALNIARKGGKILGALGPIGAIGTALATGDASAAIPIIGGSDDAGPEMGSEAYNMENNIKPGTGSEDNVSDDALPYNKWAQQVAKPVNNDETPYSAMDMARAHRDLSAQAQSAGKALTDKDFGAIKDLATQYAQQRQAPAAPRYSTIPADQRPEAQAVYVQQGQRNNQGGGELTVPWDESEAQEKKKGGVFQGSQKEMAGDTVPAKVNAGELVQNVAQQQRTLNMLQGKPVQDPESTSGVRIDQQLQDGTLKINPEMQKRLMEVYRGQRDPKSLGQGELLQPARLADGGDPLSQQPQLPEGFDPQTIINQGQTSAPMQNAGDQGTPVPQPAITNPDDMPWYQRMGQFQNSGAPQNGQTSPAVSQMVQDQNSDNDMAASASQVPNSVMAPQDQQDAMQAKLDAQTKNLATLSDNKVAQAAAIKAQADQTQAQTQLGQAAQAQNQQARSQAAQMNAMNEYAMNTINNKDLELQKVPVQSLTGYFSDEHRSLPEKLLTGVALFFSTLTSFITGKNPALDYIQHNIDQATNSVQADNQNKLALKSRLLSEVETGIQNRLANYQGANLSLAQQQAKQNALMGLQQIEKAKLDIQNSRLGLASNQWMYNQMQGATQAQGTGVGPQGSKPVVTDPSYLPDAEQRVAVPTYINGRVQNNYVRATNPTYAKEVNDFSKPSDAIINGVNKLLIDSQTSSTLSPEDRARENTIIQGQILGGLKQLNASGKLNDSEVERLEGVIGTPGQFHLAGSGPQQAALRTLRENMLDQKTDLYSKAGIDYESPNDTALKAQLKKAGLPETDANKSRMMNVMMKNGQWNPRY